MTLNTESDTLQFVRVGGLMEQLTKIYDTYFKRSVHGAIPEVGFKLINDVLCLLSEFEDHKFCLAENCHCVPFYEKLACITDYFVLYIINQNIMNSSTAPKIQMIINLVIRKGEAFLYNLVATHFWIFG